MQRRFLLSIYLLVTATSCFSQTLGGNAVFNFIAQPNTAQSAALGGVNISAISKDVGMAFHNPALLKNEMSNQLNSSILSFIAGIQQYSITYSKHLANCNLNIGGGILYLNYGSITQTDAAGFIMGTIRPTDYVAQIMVAKNYKNHFRIGATTKLIQSHYGQYQSSGIAVDIGLTYFNEAAQLQTSLVIKNMGTQLKSYAPNASKEELPFDVQLGISKKLLNAPMQFSLTAHHLQQLNIYYDDTTFNAFEGNLKKENLTQKILSHLILASQFYITDKIELSAGFNFLRSQSLNAYGTPNGLNGFSFGTGVIMKKMQVRYATGLYQQHFTHHFSLNFNLAGKNL